MAASLQQEVVLALLFLVIVEPQTNYEWSRGS